MIYATKRKAGDWVDEAGADSFSAGYKTLLEAVLDAQLDAIKVDDVLPEGYALHHCDLYNLDTSNQEQILFSSGILRYCINGKRKPQINFTS